VVKRVRAESSDALPAIVGLLRGRVCDLRDTALDDQQGNLHVPIVTQSREALPVGELVVRRVVEFAVGDIAGLHRFELAELAYDEESGQLAVRSEQAERFLLTVDRVDVTLSLL
jgi:hypothetical protein